MSRSSDPSKAAKWRELFARRKDSPQSTREFCAAEGITLASYYGWRRKLGLSKPRVPKPRTERVFQQLIVNPSVAVFSARLPGGIEIDVPSSEEVVLRTVVSELVTAGRLIETGPPSC